MQDLFRSEAREASQTPSFGRIVLVQTAPQWLMVSAALVTMMVIGVCIRYVDYTKHQIIPAVVRSGGADIQIFAPATGVLGPTAFKEGDPVKKGQILFRFSLDRSLANGGSSIDEIRSQQNLKRTLLLSERDAQQSAFDSDEQMARADITHLVEQTSNLQDQINLIRNRINSAQQIVKTHEQLFREGFEAEPIVQQRRDELNELLLRSVDMRRQQSVTAQQLQIRRLGVDQLKERRVALQAQYAREDLDVQRQLSEEASGKEWTVVAPADGILVNLNSREGETIAASTAIGRILPNGGELDAVLYATSSEIGRLKIGQDVNVRVLAYPHIKFGGVDGQIASIAPTPIRPSEITSERSSLPSTVGAGLVYPIRVNLKAQSLSTVGHIHALRPGMEAEGVVALDTRKIYEWIYESMSGGSER